MSADAPQNIMTVAPEEKITLKVKLIDGSEVFFKLKKSTQLRKLMDAYCDRVGVAINSVDFFYGVFRISANHTPDQLNIKDGDEIHAVTKQQGGC